MIKAEKFTKFFDSYKAVNEISFVFEEGCIYGLVGTNGSGKSTFLRGLSGIYTPDSGNVFIDDMDISTNPLKKSDIFLVTDDSYFFMNASLDDMAKFYSSIYANWSNEVYETLINQLPLERNKNINTFSKGMKRQAVIILALAVQPKFLLLDEAFDGLDPVIRVAVRKMVAQKVFEDKMTVIVASHNLRELEDFCDTVLILHKGEFILQQQVQDIISDFCKMQAGFKTDIQEIDIQDERILSKHISGRFMTVVAKTSKAELEEIVKQFNPLVTQYIPLTLEEVFIYEMEAIGYDYNNIIF